MKSKQPRSQAQPKSKRPLFKAGQDVVLRSNPHYKLAVIETKTIWRGLHKYRVSGNAPGTTSGQTWYFEDQLQSSSPIATKQSLTNREELRGFMSALHLNLASEKSRLFSLNSGSGIEVRPYQLRAVTKMIRSPRPRLLLADETGLGKTVEAALILQELQARHKLSSVLILCPKHLVEQWLNTTKQFGEDFLALDGKLLRQCVEHAKSEGKWPNEHSNSIIPFSLLNQDLLHSLLNLDRPLEFDLAIVDEAHHIRDRSSCIHHEVRYFCDSAEAALLLTATPIQLHGNDLFVHLNLLRPDLVPDEGQFEHLNTLNHFIIQAAEDCRAGNDGWQKQARMLLEQAAETEAGESHLLFNPVFEEVHHTLSSKSITDAQRVQLIERIQELSPFSGIIHRTRSRDIGHQFSTRRALTIEIPFTPSQQKLYDGFMNVMGRLKAARHGDHSVEFMTTMIQRQSGSCLFGLAPLLKDIINRDLDKLEFMTEFTGEMDYASLVDLMSRELSGLLAEAWGLGNDDPKAEALIKAIEQKQPLANNKVLVFSAFRHTLAYLSGKLKEESIPHGVIHGGISPEERLELRQRFALHRDDPNAIDVLLSSDVISEGLGFEFCDFVANYDSLWNPMRIQQRIGRIDRYGQQSEIITILNFFTPGTIEPRIYHRCLERIGVFNRFIGGTEEILGQPTDQLHDIAESTGLTPEERNARTKQLAENKIREKAALDRLEEDQAELVGLNASDIGVQSAHCNWLTSDSLRDCVSSYFNDRLENTTGDFDDGSQIQTFTLSPPERMKLLDDFHELPNSPHDSIANRWKEWLEGPSSNLKVDYSQNDSADEPDVVLLTTSHPLAMQATRHLVNKENVSVSLSARHEEIPPGQYPFIVYRWIKGGIRGGDELVVVASNPMLEAEFLSLLHEAEVIQTDMPDQTQLDAVEVVHYHKWAREKEMHVETNRSYYLRQFNSLSSNHDRRKHDLNKRIENADDDTRKLLEAELACADADFQRRVEELRRNADGADIHAEQVFTGGITIHRDLP